MIGKHEPNLEKAAWNVFGDSYRYRQEYNKYKAKKMAEEAMNRETIEGQMTFDDILKLQEEEQ